MTSEGAKEHAQREWIDRVREADATAERVWRELGEYETHEGAMTGALVAIAAELRAQRIARRPGAGQ